MPSEYCRLDLFKQYCALMAVNKVGRLFNLARLDGDIIRLALMCASLLSIIDSCWNSGKAT